MNTDAFLKIFNSNVCLLLLFFFTSCKSVNNVELKLTNAIDSKVFVRVLGIVQDAGYPQINCKKSCCIDKWKEEQQTARVSCLGIGDQLAEKFFIIDATPDFKYQLTDMQNSMETQSMPNGIFLTHAHIGHYTGLMDLGREAMGADSAIVYAMPKMIDYLSTNGPWSQLVSLKNIHLLPLQNEKPQNCTEHLSVMPILVPHRDEFSETVGFLISGPYKKMLFIPDIDKWSRWDQDIKDWIAKVDYALLDGTFFRNGEIFGRDMSQIPHPFIEESTELFNQMSVKEKSKIHFIHLNHTNPLLNEHSPEYKAFIKSDFNVAFEGQIFDL